LVLFVLASLKDRDPEVQTIFMTVLTSTHVIILHKVPELNKCPLKVSLVEVSQEMPNKVKDNIIVKMSISDYVSQECHFIVRVVFPHHNSSFSHLKDTICLKESLAFVVGQMEIIDNKFYMYSKDINYINTHFIKKKSYKNNLSQSSLASQNNVQSKLIITYQNIAENLENKLGYNNLLSINSSDVVDKPELDCSYLLEYARDDIFNKFIKNLVNTKYEFQNMKSNNLINFDCKNEISRSVNKRKFYIKKIKEPIAQSLRKGLKSYNTNANADN
ncbi:11272_t:CDS:2, partial [Diversispora eburnea]